MKKAVLLSLVMVLVLFSAASTAAVIYQNDYEGGTVGAGFGGWNWGTDICAHSAVFADVDGNIVVRHTGTVNNTTTAAANARFGTKWDITVSGNTSADPADYTVSFKIRNVSGNWDPITLGLAVVTWAPGATSGDDQGHGYANTSFAQADGWVQVEFNLAAWANNWWQGTNWDLTQSRWSLELGQGWPGDSFPAGTSFVQVWEMDDLKITMGSDAEPHDSVVLPDNGDGTSGTLVSQASAQVTLGWMAGGDPNIATNYPVNPAILGHYVYLSSGAADDSSLFLLDYVPQVHDADPSLTDPYNEYGPITLNQGATYYWQVEEALDDGMGIPYGAGDPNNIMGQVWSFNVIGAVPQIFAGPEHALADFSGNAAFSVTTGAVATDFRWFKVGSPDIQLADGGIYSGTQTNTLVITGAAVSDEGQFYCVAYNGNPDEGGIPSAPSKLAKLWYPRLVSHYPFEMLSGGITSDVISGFDVTMMSDDTGTDVPVLDAGVPGLAPDAYALKLDNPGLNDPNTADGQFAQAAAGVVDYTDITLSLWVRPGTLPGWARVLDFGTGTNNYLFLTADAGWGVMRFAIRTPDVEEQLLETGALAAGQWSHVAVTITGSTGRLYRNGELVATNTNMTLNPIDVGATLNYLGKSQWPDAKFNGLIDDLKIWNYALSAVDAAHLYLDIEGGSVCNREIYNLQAYDTDGDCRIGLADFASFAERWLEDQRIYAD